MPVTFNYTIPGNLCSCVHIGQAIKINETTRMYLVPGKFDKTYVDGLVVSITPTEVFDSNDNEWKSGNLYSIEIQDEDLPTGVGAIEGCDIENFGCPGDVNLDWITEDLVVGARLEPDPEDPNCINLIVTKQKFQFVAQKIGGTFESQSQHCNIHPYPYTSDPATW